MRHQIALPFLHTQANLPSKTFRWNVLDKATPPSFWYNLHKGNIFLDRLKPHAPVRLFLWYKISKTNVKISQKPLILMCGIWYNKIV